MTSLVLDVLALASILSSILCITSKNPVVAIVYLISVFICAAGYLLVSGIAFIGITYILLYVGAITILFLFVLMSINISLTDIMEAGKQYTKNIPLALSIGILFLYEVINLLPKFIFDTSHGILSIFTHVLTNMKYLNVLLLQPKVENTYDSSISNNLSLTDYVTTDIIYSTSTTSHIDSKLNSLLQVEALGQELYTHGSSCLVLTSFILLLALVCPSLIIRNSK